MVTVEDIIRREAPAVAGPVPPGVDPRLIAADDGLRRAIRLVDELLNAVRTGTGREWRDWELIYGTVFGEEPHTVGGLAKAALEENGFLFPDYCDPDTSYEEDAKAWIAALRSVAKAIHSARMRAEGIARSLAPSR